MNYKFAVLIVSISMFCASFVIAVVYFYFSLQPVVSKVAISKLSELPKGGIHENFNADFQVKYMTIKWSQRQQTTVFFSIKNYGTKPSLSDIKHLMKSEEITADPGARRSSQLDAMRPFLLHHGITEKDFDDIYFVFKPVSKKGAIKSGLFAFYSPKLETFFFYYYC